MEMKTRVIGGTAGAMMLAMSFIAPWEGVSTKAYLDLAKVWTICHGHTDGVFEGMVVDMGVCKVFLKSDVGKAMSQVNKAVKVPLHEHELAAYTSFVFNLGIKRFLESTMLRLLNRGHYQEACKQFPRWKFIGPKDCTIKENKCPGIPRRREAEMNLCLGAGL